MARTCPKDSAELNSGTEEHTLVCPSCGTHYYSMGTLIEDRGQGAPHGSLLTRSLLPQSVIKIKPSNTRK